MSPHLAIEDGALCLYAGPVDVVITRSDGVDGALLVMIDTSWEPDGSDPDGGSGLRVLLNDAPIYNAVPYEPYPEPSPNAARREFFVYGLPEQRPEGVVFGPPRKQERHTVRAVDHEHARRQGADLLGISHHLVTAMDRIELEAFVNGT